jgi:outer membrane protein assembly factor BamB
MMNSSLFAVTPLVLAPMAALGMLFPALVAGPRALFRRWWVFLNVCTLNTTLYTACVVFTGVRKRFWWTRDPYLWSAMAIVCVSGAVWAWYRGRRTVAGETTTMQPWRTELMVLGVVSMTGFATVGFCLLDDRPVWHPLLAVWVAAWAGLASAVYGRYAAKSVPPLQATMLVAMALTCAAYGALALPGDRLIVWTFSADDRGVIAAQPLAVEGRIYAGAALRGVQPWGGLYCMDPTNGKAWWSFNDGHHMNPVTTSPCFGDGRVYVAAPDRSSPDEKLYCLDAASGQKLWELSMMGLRSASLAAGESCVYFGTDRAIYCLDAVHGYVCWQHAAEWFDPEVQMTLGLLQARPHLAGGRLYGSTGRCNGPPAEVFCLSAETGDPIWRMPLLPDVPALGVTAPPATAGQRVYFGLGSLPQQRGGHLLTPRPSGALLCADAGTGCFHWKHQVPSPISWIVADEKRVYSSHGDALFALDHRDGRLIWETNFGSSVDVAATVVGTRLYAITRAGRLSCLDTRSGSLIGTIDLPKLARAKPYQFSSPTVVAGRIYIGTGMDHLITGLAATVYCLQDFEP